MSDVVIRLEQVTKVYRSSHLGKTSETVGIESLDLSIQRGEVFGLLGLNGSGKTTTIKTLLGLLYPTTGRLELLGHVMPDPRALRKIGYLPEAAYMNKYLTGRETIALFAALGDVPSEGRTDAVDAMLNRVGMQDWADKRIGEYSKGMVQRIAIAQALIHDPEILIFDEPITGLDPLAIGEIRELILWLKKQGKTIFLSSHDISEVERVCDRIGILTAGKLAKIVAAQEWQSAPDALENLFRETADGTSRVGPLRFS
jgi:ABC-2 type transport system ATP-binding protein